MKVAAIQMVSTPRVDENLQQALSLVRQAAEAGAELIGLPEYFCLMGLRDADKLAIAEELGHGPLQEALSAAAREHQVWLMGGTLPIKVPGQADRVFNTTLVYNPNGERVARYDKIHLFRFDDGQRRYDEAATLRAGTQPVAFAATSRSGQTWRTGLSVCYDLRFPELYRALMQPASGGPCEILTAPAAFTYPTGQAHWELLLRTRAVENQCFMIAPAQGGTHENGRRTWGHAMVINPWGEVLAVQDEGPGVVLADLDRARLDEVRTQLPALTHRVL